MHLLIGIITGLAIAFGSHQVILKDDIPQFEFDLPPSPPRAEQEEKFVVSDAKISQEPGQDPSINTYGAKVCFNNVPIKFKEYFDFTAKVKTYYCDDKPLTIVVNTYATESIKRPWGEIEQHNKQLFTCKLSSSDNFQVPRFENPVLISDDDTLNDRFSRPVTDPELIEKLNCQLKLKEERLSIK